MKCPKCSTKNPTDSKFCNECGTELAPPSVTKTLQTPPASPGKTIAGKYKIVSELGRGGMGVVYKAKDTRLKRTVALKFLPAELTKDKEAKRRFIQEAQAAAALSHPNITVIHEVDETEGQAFIAMEFIEGESLKDKLKEGPLDIDEAKEIVLQVAEGLKEAHEKGIVHRDIKPANVMLTKKGQAKITDFGLAKLSWGVDLTKTSTIMGTVAYMSPEQAKGEEVDHRTDIWSLGAMLYEMLSGERPFQKSQEQALIYAILNDKTTPLALIRSDIPTHIECVIEKALAKKASERYQNIQELIQELKLSISFPKTEKSIVVLPFENLSPDPEQEYFCDGMTEEIISDLSKIKSLRVISRTSAMMLKGTRKSMKAIGRELDVEYVLEGSVRKAGGNLRITAQLIEAANDTHLWAEKYTGTLDDVFDIQEKVSRSIVEALKVKLSPEEEQKIADRPIDDFGAYEYYLRARQKILVGSEKSLEDALRYLQEGLEIFGEKAEFYAGIAMTYFYYLDFGIKADENTLREAEKYANKVKQLNPESSICHYLIGRIARHKGNLMEAVEHFKRALALDPNDPDTLLFLSWHYGLFAGNVEAAEPLAKKLIQIDPLTIINNLLFFWFELLREQWDSAIEVMNKILKMHPDFGWGYFFLIQLLGRKKEFDEAIKVADKILSMGLEDRPVTMSLFFKYVFQKENEKALQLISEEMREFIRLDPEMPWWTAGGYSLINEKEEALNCIERAIERGWINYPLFSETDPFLDNIRGEPRFKKLMERVKHEWENFEV